MIRGWYVLVVFGLFLSVVVSCSTEKNTLINRSYHGLTAHYNGYFNANELIRQSLNTYRESAKEDYYSILDVELVPNEDEVIGMYPALDTAIGKCKKVIQNHSMPSNDRPHLKKDEHNNWIDENWITIGIASYYRRDYDAAMKNFLFVKKFYKNDPSLFVGELWMAKTNIAQGNLTKAKFNLDNLDKAIAEEEDRSKQKKTKSKVDKLNNAKTEKPAKFPKKIRFDVEKTKANLAILKEENTEAIKHLEKSLEFAKASTEKTRVHFILGQLYEDQGDNQKAEYHYGRVLKGNAPFQMSFNARLKKAFLSTGPKKKKHLHKMLKDAKNAEYKDQIYYALAGVAFQEGDEQKGVHYLHQTAFYSTTNTRQKGMAYEDLGDMRFAKRDYVNAQKYYDSCASVITDTYPNAEAIRNKARNLRDLVVAVETAMYEDSVQRIALLPENDREDFLQAYIKKTKEDEQRRKEREAERLRELQANENLFVQGGTGSKWYWNNAKTRAEGYEEFKRLWGNRENEDHWRRSEKTLMAVFNEENPEGEVLAQDSTGTEPMDTLTVEYLTSKLPLGDSLMALSNERLLEAHYNAGVIYKEQLSEEKMAIAEFQAVLDRKVENKHNLMSAFQLYKIYEDPNPMEAGKQKSYILNNYPNSDYANYLRDPDYFIKKKERDLLAEQEYVTVLDRYNRGLYYPVISRADVVINDEKDNVFRAKYMLLKALATGQIKEDKQSLLPILNQVIEEYPETPEAEKAKELIDIINQGYSENIVAEFGNKFPFTYDDRAKQWVLIFLDPEENSTMAKTKVTEFHREFFSRDRLRVDSKIYGNGSVIIVKEFEDERAAAEYIRVYKKTRKHLLDLQNAKTVMITIENLRILFEKQNLPEYELFYEEYY